jgi:RNA polymerase sigma-70 factor (ECF subfamily)
MPDHRDHPPDRDRRRRQHSPATEFRRLYDEHLPLVLARAIRDAPNRDVAEDATAEAFARLWKKLDAGEPIENPPAWTWTVARNLIVDWYRSHARQDFRDPSDNEPDPTTIPPEDGDLELPDWDEIAGALGARERELLTLHYKRDIDVEGLTRRLKDRHGNPLTTGAIYTQLSRARSAWRQAIVSWLLLRAGRARCRDLDGLPAAGVRLTPDLHSTVRAHLEHCPVCEETERDVRARAATLSGLALVPMSPQLSDAIWSDVQDRIAAAAGDEPDADLGDPTTAVRPRRVLSSKAFYGIGAGALLLAVLVALLISRDDGSPPGAPPGFFGPQSRRAWARFQQVTPAGPEMTETCAGFQKVVGGLDGAQRSETRAIVRPLLAERTISGDERNFWSRVLLRVDDRLDQRPCTPEEAVEAYLVQRPGAPRYRGECRDERKPPGPVSCSLPLPDTPPPGKSRDERTVGVGLSDAFGGAVGRLAAFEVRQVGYGWVTERATGALDLVAGEGPR